MGCIGDRSVGDGTGQGRRRLSAWDGDDRADRYDLGYRTHFRSAMVRRAHTAAASSFRSAGPSDRRATDTGDVPRLDPIRDPAPGRRHVGRRGTLRRSRTLRLADRKYFGGRHGREARDSTRSRRSERTGTSDVGCVRYGSQASRARWRGSSSANVARGSAADDRLEGATRPRLPRSVEDEDWGTRVDQSGFRRT